MPVRAPHADRCRPLRRLCRLQGRRLINVSYGHRQAIGNQLVTERNYRLVNDQSGRMAMEKRKPNEAADGEAVANPDGTPEQPQRRIDLPAVESPSISPVELGEASDSAAASTAEEAEASTAGTARENTSFSLVEFTAPKRPRFALRSRHKRYALLVASVAIAAVVGAVTGAATTGGFSKAPPVDVAGVEENKAMQQSVARLTKEITSLKASLDAANRSASSQIAKISERLNRETTNVTGSVPPQTQATPAPARPELAANATQPRLSILPDWTIRETRDGLVYVQGHGDIYQVVPGAPLPGLGPVEQIRRQDGRWLVVTPKGIIVSMRDRRYFGQF